MEWLLMTVNRTHRNTHHQSYWLMVEWLLWTGISNPRNSPSQSHGLWMECLSTTASNTHWNLNDQWHWHSMGCLLLTVWCIHWNNYLQQYSLVVEWHSHISFGLDCFSCTRHFCKCLLLVSSCILHNSPCTSRHAIWCACFSSLCHLCHTDVVSQS